MYARTSQFEIVLSQKVQQKVKKNETKHERFSHWIEIVRSHFSVEKLLWVHELGQFIVPFATFERFWFDYLFYIPATNLPHSPEMRLLISFTFSPVWDDYGEMELKSILCEEWNDWKIWQFTFIAWFNQYTTFQHWVHMWIVMHVELVEKHTQWIRSDHYRITFHQRPYDESFT